MDTQTKQVVGRGCKRKEDGRQTINGPGKRLKYTDDATIYELLNGSSLPPISLCSCSKDVAEVHGVLAAARRRSLTTQDYTQRPLKADSLASIQPNHPSGGRDGIETKARGR
ncbi:uncharacterized protein [Procambarus clarkii]|uniref:uncharacterized protein isoform X2 n=1 Tax=Procambarus clarkii TaxID=6728 RepID=UPI003743C45A